MTALASSAPHKLHAVQTLLRARKLDRTLTSEGPAPGDAVASFAMEAVNRGLAWRPAARTDVGAARPRVFRTHEPGVGGAGCGHGARGMGGAHRHLRSLRSGAGRRGWRGVVPSAVGSGPGRIQDQRRPRSRLDPRRAERAGAGHAARADAGPRDQGLQPGRTVGRVHDGGAGSHRCAPTGAHADTTVHVAAVAAGRRGDRGCPAAPGGDADRTKRGRSVDRDGSGERDQSGVGDERRERRRAPFPTPGCRLPTRCRLPTPAAGCRLPVAGCRLPVAGYRSHTRIRWKGAHDRTRRLGGFSTGVRATSPRGYVGELPLAIG